MKYGRNCLSYPAQLPVLNGRKCSATFHESSNISFNISYLDYYYNLISLIRHASQPFIVNRHKYIPTFLNQA